MKLWQTVFSCLVLFMIQADNSIAYGTNDVSQTVKAGPFTVSCTVPSSVSFEYTGQQLSKTGAATYSVQGGATVPFAQGRQIVIDISSGHYIYPALSADLIDGIKIQLRHYGIPSDNVTLSEQTMDSTPGLIGYGYSPTYARWVYAATYTKNSTMLCLVTVDSDYGLFKKIIAYINVR